VFTFLGSLKLFGMSALPPIAAEMLQRRERRYVPIVLQKSFCTTDHKFSEL
jgi:hypothetical protein